MLPRLRKLFHVQQATSRVHCVQVVDQGSPAWHEWVGTDMDQSRNQTLSRIQCSLKTRSRFYSTETATPNLLLRTRVQLRWIYTRDIAVHPVAALALSHAPDIT